MFLFRVKVEELDAQSLSAITSDLRRGETSLRAHCPIREMNLVEDARASKSGLDIYLALDDIINSVQIGRLFKELRAMLHIELEPREGHCPRISTEVIHI